MRKLNFYCRFVKKNRGCVSPVIIKLFCYQFRQIMEIEKKRGGRRPGAGRKKSTVKRYGFNAPANVHEVLQKVDSITEFICEAILKHGHDKGLC